jgi:hypothetical protein
MRTLLIGLLFAAAPAFAETCAEARARVEAGLSARLALASRRALAIRVQAALTPLEAAELRRLSTRFNAVPHAGEGIAERFALQVRAREITRAAAARAGFPPRNPAHGSPYDAVIEQRHSTDGLPETLVEVRSMLVLADPRPHVTVWFQSQDPGHNPDGLITLGLGASPADDYASWRGPDGRRVRGSWAEFVATKLPAACR